jgi:iron-sulfur cluster assembly accessory protein
MSTFGCESEALVMSDMTKDAVVSSEEDYFQSLMQESCATTTTTQTQLVSLTATAAEKVRSLLEQEGDAQLGLRVFVAGGGCSGLQYGMTLDEEQEGDTIVAAEGVRVLVDEMSAQYLSGSEIDYVDSLMGAGFTVNNPNAVSTCGCGHSFKTASDSGQARGCGN